MSTGYGYRCRTCDDGTCWEWQSEYLRQLHKLWPQVRALLDRAQELGCWQIDVEVPAELKEFLHDHYGHQLAVQDEYGKETIIMSDDEIRRACIERRVKYSHATNVEGVPVTEYVVPAEGSSYLLVWVKRNDLSNEPLFTEPFEGDPVVDPLFKGVEASKARKKLESEFWKHYGL